LQWLSGRLSKGNTLVLNIEVLDFRATLNSPCFAMKHPLLLTLFPKLVVFSFNVLILGNKMEDTI
jgi:hypothetical protein